MSSGLVRLVLRSAAIAIAVAGVVDPAFSRNVAAAPPIVAIDLTSGAWSGIERALREELGGRELLVREPAGDRLPCGPNEDCVLIADGSAGAGRAADAERPLSMIVSRNEGAPNVEMRSVTVATVHQAASGVAQVELMAEGMQGRSTEIRVLDGSAVVGSAIHTWSAPAGAAVDVSWWPLTPGARALRVEAVPFEGERTMVDNHIDVGATILSSLAGVMVFDARPSWTSTFVRRALENDGGFSVRHRARIAPALVAGTANAALDVPTLDEVSTLVVGGPDALTPEEIRLLDRYVRIRGGSLVLLPERRSDGPLAALFPGTWTEHLTATPESIGPLRASEILRMTGDPGLATVIARSASSPVIVSVPAGNGRIIVSGAMDAWRYRQLESGAFDRFWRTLVAASATAGDGLSLALGRTLAPIGSRVSFTLRDRHFDERSAADASATMRCGDGPAETVRLWPAGSVGEFEGELPAASAGQCVVEATVGDRVATKAFSVAERATAGVEETLAQLERTVRESGGVVATVGRERDVATAVGSTTALSSVVSVHPMRAAWWMLPFAACLTAEWWLRRREGLR